MRNEAWYRAKLQQAGVPEYMHDGYVLYLLHGLEPGSFMTAVLGNDLREACGRADEENRRALYQHVAFLYNYAPSACWGSYEHVRSWLQRFRNGVDETTTVATADGRD